MITDDVIRIFVGTDRSQLLAFYVLKHSILKHTNRQVQITPMLNLSLPIPKNPKNWQRTGFSFSRFCIPKLCGYKGKALYLDADMLVFSDIQSLWDMPFYDKKVMIQEAVKYQSLTTNKLGAPAIRQKQTSVMLLDCGKLDWDIEIIVNELDNDKYDYDALMFDLCILDEKDIQYSIPFEWNSLEYWEHNTHLLHYTDVYTQPWVHAGHKYAYHWLEALSDAIQSKQLTKAEVIEEIQLGYCRPSLWWDINYSRFIPKVIKKYWDQYLLWRDNQLGFIKHKHVYEKKHQRKKAMKHHLEKLEKKRDEMANEKT